MSQPIEKVVGPTYIFALYDRVCVQLWFSLATLEDAQALRRFTREHASRIDTNLVVVDGFTGLPSDVTRDEFVAMSRESERSVRSLIVFEREGFKAAALRALVTGILSLSGQRHTMKVFSSLGDAVEWARFSGDVLPGLPELTARISALRTEARARAA